MRNRNMRSADRIGGRKMSTILFLKKTLMSFINFMYLNEEEQIIDDMGLELSFKNVMKAMGQIIVCMIIAYFTMIVPNL